MRSAAILVVEDDAALRRAMSRALRAAGYLVREAESATEALRALNEDVPDILLTDMLMPDGDGVELISAVRRLHASLRILAISGRRELGGLNLLELAQALGADATLPKPLTGEEIVEAIGELLE